MPVEVERDSATSKKTLNNVGMILHVYPKKAICSLVCFNERYVCELITHTQYTHRERLTKLS